MFNFKSAHRHANSKKLNILNCFCSYKGRNIETQEKLIYFEEETESKIILVGVLEIDKGNSFSMKRYDAFSEKGKNLLKYLLENPSSFRKD